MTYEANMRTKRNNSTAQGNTLFIRLVLLVLTVSILWFIGSYSLQRWGPETSIPIEIRQAAHQKTIKYRFGHVNNIPFTIPNNLFFPIEYADKSIWDPNKGKNYYVSKTHKDAIREFTINVQWLTMEPRQPKNEKSFLKSSFEPGPHEWIKISVMPFLPKGLSGMSPKAVDFMATQPDNYLARRVRGRLAKLSKPFRIDGESLARLHPEIQYKLSSEDREIGLKKAVPVGPGTEKSQLWNKVIYWSGDRFANVSTFIRCPNGKFPNPKVAGLCSHTFDLPELRSQINVLYSPNWLTHWRDIEVKARELILSFQTKTQTQY